MGKYRVQGPDGKVYVVEAPDGASQQQILAFAETNIGLAPPPTAVAPKPKADINDTNFLKDTAASVISGVGQLLELPSQVYGLATGDFKTAIGDMASSVTKYGEDMKSPGLKARAEAAQARIDKADKEGFFSGLGTGISEYLSDPRLLASGVAETIPSLFGTAGAGALASTGAKKILGRELAEQAAKRATLAATPTAAGTTINLGATAAERAVQRAALTGGVGFGAVQQGADVGTDAYVRAMETPDAVWSQNPEFMGRVQAGEDPTQVKEDMALSVARQSAIAAGGVSGLTAGVLPGTFEKAVLGKSLSGSGLLSRTGKGFAGEALQEAGEEGGGRLASNIAMRQINPEQALLEGVGSQAGIAAVLGGVSGAGASAAFGGGAEPTTGLPPETPPPAPVFIAPVITAPPSEGLISVLGQPGTDVTVDDNGTPTPYTFGGLSDEGHVILVDPEGGQYFTDPASLEGIVSPTPVAAAPVGEAPIESPPVETPPGVSTVGVPPSSTLPGEPPAVGVAPVEDVPVEMPPAGAPPTPAPAGGSPLIDVTEPSPASPVVEPGLATPPVSAPPSGTGPVGAPTAGAAPTAPPVNEPGEQIPPAAADDAFTQEEGELARTPNADLANALRGKNAVGAATYLADNAKSTYLRGLNKNVASMMKTLQNMGYKFSFNMVSPTTKSADPKLAKTISNFKRQKGVLGQVSTSGMGGIGMSMSDILLRDINYPNAQSGANEATATHEFIHAVTAGLIYQYERGRVDKNSRVGKSVGDLISLQKQAKKYFYDVIDGKITVPQRTKEIIQSLANTNAFQNAHELLTYGLTDWRMQFLLKQIEVKKVNGFTAFIRSIGKMLGLSDKDTNGLRKLIEITEEVIPVTPAKQKRNASLIRFGETTTAPTLPSEEGVETVTTPEEPGVGATGIGEEAAPVTPDDTQAVTDEAVSEIVNSSREEGDNVISDSGEPIKKINEARLDLQMEGQSVPKFSAKALAKQGQVMPPTPPSVDAISNIGMLGSFTPASALARANKYFRAMFDNMNDKLAFRNLLMSRPEKLFAEITRMPQESKDKLNQVMEYLRLSATPIKEKPDQFSITTEKLFRDNKYVAPALSKPGDTLKLSKEETAILYQIRDYLDETYTLNAQSILQAVGYNGVYSLEGIQSLPAETAKEISRRDSLLRLYNAIESQRVTSYIPFMRDGDVRVIVKQKITDANGKEKTDLAAFYMLDSNQWLREIVGPTLGRAVPDNAFNKRLAEIKKKYPESQGYTVVDTRLAGNINDKLQLEDLGTLDKLVSLMNANSGKSIKDYFDNTMAGLIDTGELDEYSKAYAEQLAKGYISDWPDQIRDILMKQIASNFMKQSQNVPGYDTNLIDKLFDYNRIVASTISHRRYQPEYSKAKDEMVRNHAPGSSALRYALSWDKNADTPEHVLWRGARAVGFYNAMWGSFSSSMVNAMSMWTVVAPQMYVMSKGASKEMYKNSVKMIGAISLDKNIGAYINVDKIRGLSPDEREALNWAYKTGTVRAQINPDLMGMNAGLLKTKGGKIGESMRRYFDIGASVVSVTEEMNKVAAFLAAYKYAQDPKALSNWKKAFANNERAKAIMEAGSDPRAVAAFMTETTTFIGGQIENAPIMRGAGGVAFQFAQYPLQMAFLMYQNFAKMGPRGKQAGLFTLLTMFSVSGLLFAIPFGDDAINIFEWLTEKITGKKRDFRLETQQMLVDLFGEGPEAQRNAEALLYGPFRSLLGLNIGERIGFSSMLPEMNNPITAIPALSGTLGKIEEYKNRKPDQPIGAYTALLSPVMGKGVTDVMKGLVVFPQEGYRTQFGSNIKSPEDITAGEQFARTLGFQSAEIARLVRAKRAGEEINTATAGKERNNTRRLGKILADAIRLEKSGDEAGADRLRSKFQSEIQSITEQFQQDIQEGNLANGVKPPSSEALREAVMFDLYPETRINNYGKLKRAAILDARRDLLLSGEEDFPDLMEEAEEEEEEGGFDAAFPE